MRTLQIELCKIKNLVITMQEEQAHILIDNRIVEGSKGKIKNKQIIFRESYPVQVYCLLMPW